VGLTAGASAPDILVQQVIARLRALGATSVRRMDGVEEHVHFPLPKGLGDRSMSEFSGAPDPDAAHVHPPPTRCGTHAVPFAHNFRH
jgi:hypothetical protein